MAEREPRPRSSSSSQRSSRPQRSSGSQRSSDSRDPKESKAVRPGKGLDARAACAIAAGYAQELTGHVPEGVTSLQRTDDGWQIGVEVVESRRIPDSTDILAVYLIGLDQDGGLLSYRRQERYHRGRVDGSSSE